MKMLVIVLLAVTAVQSASVSREKRQYTQQYAQPVPVQQTPVPVPSPVPAPLPVPIVPPMGMVGGSPIVDLLLLSTLFGGGGFGGGRRGGYGGGHHGGRYRRENEAEPEAEALEMSEPESLPILSGNAPIARPEHELFKRQIGALGMMGGMGGMGGLGAMGGMGGLGMMGAGVPVPAPIAPIGGLGITGSPIIDLLVLSSILGDNNDGYRRRHHHHRRDLGEVLPEEEALTAENEALEMETPAHEMTEKNRVVKRQIIGGGMLSPLGVMGGSPIIDLLLLQSLYGNGGIFGSNSGPRHHHH